MQKTNLMANDDRQRAEQRFQKLMEEAKRQGAAFGRLDIEHDFRSWAEAMVRPVVYLEYGRPEATPERLMERRDKLSSQLEAQSGPSPAGPLRIAISYPLAAVIMLTGAVTGSVLSLGGVVLGLSHWLSIAVASLWLTAVLHALPAGLRTLSHASRVVLSGWRRWRLNTQLARLDKDYHLEHVRIEQRERAHAERTEQLVKVYEFYREAARVVPMPQQAAA